MKRRLTTILCADIAEFSRLVGADEEGTLGAQRTTRAEVIDPLLQQHSGRVANTAGDSLLIEFPSAVEAVRFAIAAQEGIADANQTVAPDKQIQYRMGINVGDIVVSDQDLLGDGVNVAARLEALAPPGGIILSRTARDQVRDRLDLLVLGDLGEVAVKNITRPVRAFQVLRDGEAQLQVPKPAARRGRAAVAVVAALVLAIGAYWFTQRPDFTPVDPADMALILPEKPSIAVLPFETRGGDDALGWIGDGLTESIISTLSLSPDMVVIARGTAFSYKGRDVPVQDVARELGVRYVLSGSVLNAGDRLRVTAELADAVAGKQIWSVQEDRESGDLIQVQDDISRKIFEEMAVSLTVGEGARSWLAQAGGFENYTVVIQGRAEFQKFSPEGHFAAERIWGKLHQETPDQAFSTYLMGYIYWQKVRLGLSKDIPGDWARATELSQQALAIEEFGEGYTLAAILAWGSRRHEEAITYADRAVELSPGSADANSLGGMVKAVNGQVREGLELMLRGMRLEPDYPDWLPASVNFARLQLGQLEDAKALARAVLASDTKDVRAKPFAASALVVAAVFEGDMAEARIAADRLLDIFPAASASYGRKARANNKDQAFVERYLEALVQAGIPETAD